MDNAALLQSIYRAYREKRLAEFLALLSEDFRYTLHLPEDAIPGADRARSKAETALLMREVMEKYDFLAFEPGPIIIADGRASAQPEIKVRHRQTGSVLDTKLVHTWHVRDGKAVALDERHEVQKIRAFVKSIIDGGGS